ncbi:hypothetical protein [Hymenobacter fodinae]|uniref:Uncharacterized protein n=1 Tax=Hymenobacter fodinae TaxID=2510796 RepID=A0A4Z0P2F0_9BACT|nr:hypothetical protein [Hymenobacter fodinae]TGE05592.1 hypothetical protein EU556_20030 [Hymenobacter fodinae]
MPTDQTSHSDRVAQHPALALRLARRQGALTPEIARTSPQISGLSRQAPEATSEALSNLLTFAAAQLNVVRNLTNVQIALLTMDLMKRYYYWRLDEFIVMLREGIAGRLGEKNRILDRFDAQVVGQWCIAYEEQIQAGVMETDAKNQLASYAAIESGRALNNDMFRAYTRLALETRTDEELQEGIAWFERHPEAPEAALKIEVAREVVASRQLEVKKQAERIEEARAKARALIGEYDAANYPAPDLEAEAVKHFAAAKGIPKASDVLKPEPPKMEVVHRQDPNAA